MRLLDRQVIHRHGRRVLCAYHYIYVLSYCIRVYRRRRRLDLNYRVEPDSIREIVFSPRFYAYKRAVHVPRASVHGSGNKLRVVSTFTRAVAKKGRSKRRRIHRAPCAIYTGAVVYAGVACDNIFKTIIYRYRR